METRLGLTLKLEARGATMKFLNPLFRAFLALLVFIAASLQPSAAADPAPMTRPQALKALQQAAPSKRLAGTQRLAEVGTMQDTDALLLRLNDEAEQVRAEATAALWQVWSRSGDQQIDALFARGVAQMEQQALQEALKTFTDIVQRKPEFAEGWNKRATVLFLLGENEKSLSDCEVVLRLNPKHFGALSGAGQIHLKLDQPQKALDFLRRALEINPNLTGLRRMLPLLEQQVRDKLRSTA
jgi:tetratricopeptide (TPR) repeat protein